MIEGNIAGSVLKLFGEEHSSTTVSRQLLQVTQHPDYCRDRKIFIIFLIFTTMFCLFVIAV